MAKQGSRRPTHRARADGTAVAVQAPEPAAPPRLVGAAAQPADDPAPEPPTRPSWGWAVLLLAVAVLVVVVATGAAWWAGGRGPTVYGADADVVVELPDVTDAADADRRLATEVVVIEGPSVLGPVSESTGVSLDDLTRDVSASVRTGSQVIRIRATSEDRDQAVVVAGAVADQYANGRNQPVTTEAERFLQDELTRLGEEQSTLQGQLDALGAQANSAQARNLQTQLNGNLQRQAALQAQLVQQQLDEARGGGARVVAPARALDEPVAPQPVRSAALGLLAGLVVATALLVIGFRLRPSARPAP